MNNIESLNTKMAKKWEWTKMKTCQNILNFPNWIQQLHKGRPPESYFVKTINLQTISCGHVELEVFT